MFSEGRVKYCITLVSGVAASVLLLGTSGASSQVRHMLVKIWNSSATLMVSMSGATICLAAVAYLGIRSEDSSQPVRLFVAYLRGLSIAVVGVFAAGLVGNIG